MNKLIVYLMKMLNKKKKSKKIKSLYCNKHILYNNNSKV